MVVSPLCHFELADFARGPWMGHWLRNEPLSWLRRRVDQKPVDVINADRDRLPAATVPPSRVPTPALIPTSASDGSIDIKKGGAVADQDEPVRATTNFHLVRVCTRATVTFAPHMRTC
jgi:hypothetical protein